MSVRRFDVIRARAKSEGSSTAALLLEIERLQNLLVDERAKLHLATQKLPGIVAKMQARKDWQRQGYITPAMVTKLWERSGPMEWDRAKARKELVAEGSIPDIM